MISGSAAFRAALAAALSPAEIASSTLRMKPRTRVLRAVLMAVRLAVVRTRFLAEAILGIGFPWGFCRKRRAYTPEAPHGQQKGAFAGQSPAGDRYFRLTRPGMPVCASRQRRPCLPSGPRSRTWRGTAGARNAGPPP